MFDDIRHALRLMVRQRAFTALALVTIAAGVAANTAIFSMVYGVLLRPLPYPTSDRLVRISETHPGGTPIVSWPMVSNVTFHAWRKASRTLAGIGVYRANTFTLLDRGTASRVPAMHVTPSIFEILGARPLAGRLLQQGDATTNAPHVVVLSAGFWRDHFGGAPSVIGETMTLDGELYTIVGVAPNDFYFPDRTPRIWVPYAVADTPATERITVSSAIALLKPGVTPAQAAAEGTAAARSAGPRHLSANLLFGRGGAPTIDARPLLDEITATVRPALLLLLVSVGLVLLIACANVTNLLLSRGVARARELAVRAAIGASRTALARQLLAETMVLALAGGLLGLACGWMLTRAIAMWGPADFPRLADVRVDGMVLAFAMAISVLAGLLAGALPAFRVARGGLLVALRDGTGASSSGQTRRLGAGLLVAEAAVAMVLLVGAGLLGRSFMRLIAVDPGYRTPGVLMALVHLPPGAGSTDREEMFAQSLLDRVRALPGVAAAGVSNMAPFVPMTAVAQITLRGDSAEPINARAVAYTVTPGYAEALSMVVRDGRTFEPRDQQAGIRSLIVNEEFTRLHFRDGRPVVGRRFAASFANDTQVEIIGVVANVLRNGLDSQPVAEFYRLPQGTSGFPPSMNIAVRASRDPLTLVQPLQQIVRGLDAAAALDSVETLDSRVSASVSEPRFAMMVLTAFATVAVSLAAVGLYGVLSYQVRLRRREMGVRAALGATRGSIVRLVVREGVTVTVAGLVVGLLGAAWLSRLMQRLLFGVTPHDALVFTGAPLVLLVVAIAATVIPARRAAAANPIESLREQ
jgi:putative ABC transport system permease protein